MLAKRSAAILSVHMDLGAGRRGVDMGPSALRVADLEPRLRGLGLDVEDSGDINASILKHHPRAIPS